LLGGVVVRFLVSAEVFGVAEAFRALVTLISACQGGLVRLFVFCAFACAVEEFDAGRVAARKSVVDSLDSFAFLWKRLEWADLVVFETGREFTLVEEPLIDGCDGGYGVLEDDHSSPFAGCAEAGVAKSHYLGGGVDEAALAAGEEFGGECRLVWGEDEVVDTPSDIDIEFAGILSGGP
jgi:hypothetical protein